MSKEKQIEEMAEIMSHSCEGECFTNKDGLTDCAVCEACLLYEAGYRKQSEGKWEKFEGERFICSNCAKVFGLGSTATIHDVKRVWNFCPNCGARMSGGQNEQCQ